MFRCDEVANRASLMVDGELGFWPRLEIRLHLAMCWGCRAFVDQMRRTRDLTAMAGSMQDPPPSDEVMAALAQRRLRTGAKS